MEDKNIKDFDRSIEQKMNESAVPPPFGMWNRISAELEAVPTAAPASAPFPKSAIMGLVLGVVLLGGVLTASLFTREQAKPIAQANITTTPGVQAIQSIVNPAAATVVAQNAAPVNEESTPVVLPKPITQHRIISKPVEENTSVAKEENTPAVTNTDASSMTLNANNQADVPSQTTVAETMGTVDEPYYFPPVDRVVPEGTKTPNAGSMSTSSTSSKITAAGDVNDDDKKVEPAKEQKIHFKPHKKHKWGYGKIIRNK